MSWLGHTLWLLGYADQALGWCQEAVLQARAWSHLFSRALAFNYAAMLHQFRGARPLLVEHAEHARALCDEQGFVYYRAWADFMLGWATDRDETDLLQMEEGLEALLGTGAGLRQPYYLTTVAEAKGALGASEQGIELVARAQEIVESTQERMWEAEVHRVRGDIALGLGKAAPGGSRVVFFCRFGSGARPGSPFAGIAGRIESGAALGRSRRSRRGARTTGGSLRVVLPRGLIRRICRRSEVC